MNHRLLNLFGAALLLAACNKAPQNREAVQQAIAEHVTKNAGIDMSQISLELKDVKFEGNQAIASVSFRPKNAPSQGMSMSYTLERSGDKWVIKGRGAGHGNAGGSSAGSSMQMPPGHPSAGGSGGSSGNTLPPGHPPVNQPAPQK